MSDVEQVGRRGEALYEKQIRPHLDSEADRGKFIAVDTESGDYELGTERLEVMERLEARRPGARGRIWLTRVGLGYAVRFGGRSFEQGAA